MLAMPNWLSTRTSRTPSAEPVAPLHVPSAVITVADIPAPLKAAMSISAACNFAATLRDTGSSLMSANASVGKAGASLGEGDAAGAVEGSTDEAGPWERTLGVHAASATTTANAEAQPWGILIAVSLLSIRRASPSWQV